ncbi:hypothetical protein S245_052841, partial [Arachis hypogaea]
SHTPTHLLSSPLSKTQFKLERTEKNPSGTHSHRISPNPVARSRCTHRNPAAPQPRGTHSHRISSPLFAGVAPWKFRRRPRKLCRRRRKLPRRRVEALWPSPSPLFKRSLSLCSPVWPFSPSSSPPVFWYCVLSLGVPCLFMDYSDLLKLLFAIAIWCSAYITVAILTSFRAVNCLSA